MTLARYVNTISATYYFGRGGLVNAYATVHWLWGTFEDDSIRNAHRNIAEEAHDLCITNGAGGW